MNLQKEIRSAFAWVKYPGDEKLLSTPNDETRHFIGRLRGKSWHVITLEDLACAETVYDTLSALNPHALHYYLPGLLLLALEEATEGCAFGHAIITQFTAHDGENPSTFGGRQKHIRLLSSPQRAVVRHFFEWLRNFKTRCPVIIDSAIDNLANDRIRPYSSSAVKEWANRFKE